MGIAVKFGFAFATVLTLIIVPTFYFTLDDVVIVSRRVWKSIFDKDKTDLSG